MRFAYIDSQGNEVPIPSIDALALRIELGAVGPDTQLYDAQADHWGPAHTHEIFHTLSRDAEGDEFLAPPPPAPAPSVEDAAPPEPEPSPPEPEAAAPDPKPEPEEDKESDEFDLGLTLADPPPAPPEDEEVSGDGMGDVARDLGTPSNTPLVSESEPLVPESEPLVPESESLVPESEPLVSESEPLVPESEAPPPEPPAADDAGGGFDFGDIGSGLELEGSEDEEDLPLETEREFQAPAAGFSMGEDEMQLEEPMSAFEPDTPPGWMEEPDPDEVMDFSAVAEEEAAEEAVAPVADTPTRQRRTPKDRPSPPKFKKRRSLSGPIFLVVLLLALGVGGYVGWPILQARLEERNAPPRPAVVMPVIPEELLPQMRSLGETAIAAVVSDVSEATRVPDAPQGPDEDWLAGVYLGNASRYPGIEAFWVGVDQFTQGLRDADWQLYHDKYVEAVEGAGVDPEVAAQLTERADSGFVAAQPSRELAYGELQRLSDAALDLHDFLVENEDDIVFRPGVTSATDPSVDPVLEIQAPDAARDSMLGMFDEITEALDALGSLDRVTRERLVSAMTARLQQVGIE
jgi:hypothetical protein